MTPDENRRTWEESRRRVLENKAKLASCTATRHSFVMSEKNLFSKWHCIHCNGTVDAHGAYWYNIGVSHGERQPK